MKKKLRRVRQLYYVESGMGCGIRTGLSAETVERVELMKVGTYHGVSVVRLATDDDIHNVKSMGGFIPEV
jgi:hypothetical protein